RLKSVKAILTIKLTAYHRPISICFVGKKLFLIFNKMFTISPCIDREGANKRGNSSRLTQSFHFFMFEPIFSPVNALNQPI
uniref:hypothetical protein n=1 Tax=Aeromonas media TaxID=651 RepID=UPI001C57034F